MASTAPEFAIVPAAGRGTRMSPTTRWVPKELLPIGRKPMLLHVLEEAVSAGIERIMVVNSPDKPSIQHALNDLYRLDGPVRKKHVRMTRQQRPVGLADALRTGWRELGSPAEPVLSILPDNVYLGSSPSPVQALVDRLAGTEDHLSVLHRITAEQREAYGYPGFPELEEIREDRYRLTSLPSKGEPPETVDFPVLRSCGRSALSPSFFEVLGDIEDRLRQEDRELDDVPVVRTMIDRGMKVEGVRIDHRLYDVGHPDGYAAAWTAWAGRSRERAGGGS